MPWGQSKSTLALVFKKNSISHLPFEYHWKGLLAIFKRIFEPLTFIPKSRQYTTVFQGKKGIYQRELGKRLGINQTTLVHYETGRREPRIGYLMGLIRETGVDGDWLLTGKGDMYGEGKKIITKEEAIKALFGDKADEVVLFLLDAIKDPFLRAIMYTRAIEYKEQHK